MRDDPTLKAQRRTQAIDLWNQAVPLGHSADESDKNLAYRMWLSCVELDPNFWQAWYAIGNADNDVGHTDGAIACWRRVVEIAPKIHDEATPFARIDPVVGRALTNIGHKLYHQGKFKEAYKATERAVEISDSPEHAIANLAMLESVKGDNAKSLRLAQKAADLSRAAQTAHREAGRIGQTIDGLVIPDTEIFPDIWLQLAFSHLYAGNWIEGLKNFEARFPYKLKDYLKYPYPRWDGESAPEGILYVPAEMGMGDALSFLRFLPATAARVGTVRLYLMSELVRLARAMLQDWPNIHIQAQSIADFPEADAWCPLTALPVALGLTDAEFEHAPNLPVPGFALPASWKQKGRKLHVGIAWAGSPLNDIDRWRSIPFTQFLDLAKVEGVQLYGLQLGPHQQDLWQAGCGAIVRDVSRQISDVADTVAILRDFDLVITIESALGHIAGSVGKECWVAYSHNGGDYRMGRNREKPIWYPNHRIFKQGPDAEWQPVFDRLVEALRQRVKVAERNQGIGGTG